MDCVFIYYLWCFLMGVQFSLCTINKILFQTHLLTFKCHPVRFSVITTIIGSCTSTPTPKWILHVATRAGKKEKTLLAQKEIDWVCICSWLFSLGFQFTLHTMKMILLQTHLLTCKCHPDRFSVITIIESCTSTPTPKLHNFTRVHASWEEGKQWLVIWEINCMFLCSQWF